MTRKSRSSGSSKAARYLIFCSALLFLVLGFYLGYRIGEPPPPPDLASLRSEDEGSDPPPNGSSDAPSAGSLSTGGMEAGGGLGDEPASAGEVLDPAGSDTDDTTAAGAEPGASGELRLRRQPPPGSTGAPRIALVIDDLGRSVQDVHRLRRLGVTLSYAVLPFESRTEAVVRELRSLGEEVLCHLPMEAKGGANPGPGALRLSMSRGELKQTTEAALGAVPGAVGVNNHMGSAVAADREAMAEVLEVIAEHGLFFLDSRTAADTVGYSLARSRGLPAAERQVFLDTYRETGFIRDQFRALLAAARARGGAIGIAHPHEETLAVLAEEIPRARAEGFHFVAVSELVDPQGSS